VLPSIRDSLFTAKRGAKQKPSPSSFDFLFAVGRREETREMGGGWLDNSLTGIVSGRTENGARNSNPITEVL